MILPIGNNCNIATALKNIKKRNYSYPLDWILVSDHCLCNFLVSLLQLKTEKDVDTYCDIFFNIADNRVYLNDQNTEIFVNKEFEVTFLHDLIPTIKEKYKRRIKRMIKHFYEANRVDLIFASRWTRSDQTLLDIITNLSKLRSNIYLHAINGFEYEYTSFSMIKYYSMSIEKCYPLASTNMENFTKNNNNCYGNYTTYNAGF